MAIYSCRDILWVLALFLVSASMRHAITMVGARYTSSIFIWVGVFWSIPATADYVDRMMAALLFLLLDALQGHGRCATAIVGFAGSIAKPILATMNQITCKRLYQVPAMLGVVLLSTYITFAALFLSIPIVLAVSYAMQSPVVVLYYLLCFCIMAYIAPEILCIVVLAL